MSHLKALKSKAKTHKIKQDETIAEAYYFKEVFGPHKVGDQNHSGSLIIMIKENRVQVNPHQMGVSESLFRRGRGGANGPPEEINYMGYLFAF